MKKTFDVKAIILWDEKSNAEEKDFDHFAVLTLAVAVLSPSAFEAGKHCKGSHHGHGKHPKQSLVALRDSITFGYNLGLNNNQPSQHALPYFIGKEMHLSVTNSVVSG
ncbi:hypothetical protein BpJC7_25940 [Weizmannia acidilactici]|uniref:Uncharacterized protein n=1 Tax=Weizmannia acidilactici TaxID=2607726 RepID=A0A5J4JHU7_9BACI|nr:hypothetical protein [Weizmannia acidilactici]GER67429.1 hypothetical protein BpJC4_19000 [Weizmannia acidilactici]GER71291.1 hypothetical protein BpJC7_25940 [Weizmannia acidilactici]